MAFNPSRLELARKRRGLSKAALSRSSELSLRTLGYYESGDVSPSDEALQNLSDVLGFPIEFFAGNTLREIEVDRASFRSLSSTTASLRDAALSAGTLAAELNRWLSERFALPEPTIPTLPHGDPEKTADQLRADWNLGHRPIKNVLHLIEARGGRIFFLPTDSLRVDAFSVWHEGIPLVLLNPRKSGERGRMDVAHELGHLVMHRREIVRGRSSEFEADRFASAFLMPAGDVSARTPRNPTLRDVLELKKRWKVSAMALVYRLHQLDRISEWQYRSFCTTLSKHGYRRGEPDGIPRESSQIIAKTLEALRAEGVSKSEIARGLSIGLHELNSLLGGLTLTPVPTPGSGHQARASRDSPAKRPQLRIVRGRDSE